MCIFEVLVQFIEHRRQGGGLAGPGGARDEDDAGLLLDDLAKDGLELQAVHGGDGCVELPHDDGVIAVLPENIDPETAAKPWRRSNRTRRTPGGRA